MNLDLRMGSLPVRMANPALVEHFEQYAQDFLAQMERNGATTQVATKIILARMDDPSLSIEKVAREMFVSVRTLQKRLESEGVVFSDLLRDIRQTAGQKIFVPELLGGANHIPAGLLGAECLSQIVQEVAGGHAKGISRKRICSRRASIIVLH